MDAATGTRPEAAPQPELDATGVGSSFENALEAALDAAHARFAALWPGMPSANLEVRVREVVVNCRRRSPLEDQYKVSVSARVAP